MPSSPWMVRTMSSDRSTSFDEQYQSLRTGCGFVELNDWSSITATGADRQKFLNSFCTNDVKRLQPGDACEAFFTNVKGKIVGHGIISCRQDELVIIGVPDQSPTLIAHLDRYLIREDVKLQDTTDQRCHVLIAGRNAVVSDALRLLQGQMENVPVIIPCKLVGSEHEKLIELSTPKSPELVDALERAGGSPADSAFDAARIEAGTPLFKVDFDENNLPQEVGRGKEAISFTKGCYLGQETVARIDALGHVNQRIVGLQFTGREVPAVGTELTSAGAVVGRVTSSAYSPALGAPLALAMVRREANAAGKRLESAIGACAVIAFGNTNQH
jgi:tRNA-modifying protein YgfZ